LKTNRKEIPRGHAKLHQILNPEKYAFRDVDKYLKKRPNLVLGRSPNGFAVRDMMQKRRRLRLFFY